MAAILHLANFHTAAIHPVIAGGLYISLFPLADWLKQFGVTSAHRIVALLIIFGGMGIIGFRKRSLAANIRLPIVTWVVPAWFHVYFICWFFGAGFYRENGWMTFWSVTNFAAGVLIHWLLYRCLHQRPRLVRVYDKNRMPIF